VPVGCSRECIATPARPATCAIRSSAPPGRRGEERRRVMKRRVDRACPLDGSPRPHHFRGHCHCQCHLGFGRHPWTAGVPLRTDPSVAARETAGLLAGMDRARQRQLIALDERADSVSAAPGLPTKRCFVSARRPCTVHNGLTHLNHQLGAHRSIFSLHKLHSTPTHHQRPATCL
jgi:hypothetical protein